MVVDIIENEDRTFSIVPAFEWEWERAGWSQSEESQEGIFAEAYRTPKKAIKDAECEGLIVNIY